MTEFERHGITLEYLRECFYYKDGKLFWKERPRHHFKTDWSWKRFNKDKPNTEVGIKHQSGYLLVSWVVNGKKVISRVHRIIWYIETGELPNIIDHINRNRSDNRIENLRNGTYFINAQNSARTKGTNLHKATGKWVAQITHNKKRIHIGLFDTQYEAIQAYRKKVLELKGVDLNAENIVTDCVEWFKIAKPTPTDDDCKGQIIYHIEEFIEMLQAINAPLNLIDNLVKLQDNIRLTETKQFFGGINHVALLDALCDQVVTAIGVGVLLGYDMEKALTDVNRSNYTKFNADGTPYIRPDGKIGKNPETYQEPQLADYVSLTDRQQANFTATNAEY